MQRRHLLLAEHALVALVAARAVRDIWRLVRRDGYRVLIKRSLGVLLRVSTAAVPRIGTIVAAEQEKTLAGLEVDLLGNGDADALVVVPNSRSAAEIEAQCDLLRSAETHVQSGRRWGGIYYKTDSDVAELQARVWARFACTNALFPGVYPALRKFEAEVVSMVLGLVHGHECGAVGLLTSGGTESILLAVLAYREEARRRGISAPRIVAGLSAHPALLKAGAYFGVDVAIAPLGPDLCLTAAGAAPYIDANTVAIYASAPSFSFGKVDEIAELAELARARGIGLHVDNCLGGVLLTYLSRQGATSSETPDPRTPSREYPRTRDRMSPSDRQGLFTRAWDFSLAGVTSISVDVHKYGCAPKGSSVVCFRDPALRRATYVPSSTGCEGLYVTPTLQARSIRKHSTPSPEARAAPSLRRGLARARASPSHGRLSSASASAATSISPPRSTRATRRSSRRCDRSRRSRSPLTRSSPSYPSSRAADSMCTRSRRC